MAELAILQLWLRPGLIAVQPWRLPRAGAYQWLQVPQSHLAVAAYLWPRRVSQLQMVEREARLQALLDMLPCLRCPASTREALTQVYPWPQAVGLVQ